VHGIGRRHQSFWFVDGGLALLDEPPHAFGWDIRRQCDFLN
jgi:hypothetical protein